MLWASLSSKKDIYQNHIFCGGCFNGALSTIMLHETLFGNAETTCIYDLGLL
jgi:hypothetical protein